MAIKVLEGAGPFAEDKDAARDMRERLLRPVLSDGGEVELDFDGVGLATQSFIHALVSDLVRSLGDDVLDQIIFKNCNENVQELISIVVEYSQEGMPIPPESLR